MRSIKTIIFTVSIFCIVSAFPAHAACVSSDVAGKWRAFLVTGSTLHQGFARATLEFSETGNLTNNAELINSLNQRFRLVNGSVKVADSCRITGTFRTKTGLKIAIVDGQLNSSKDVISGVYRTSTKDSGLINLIK
ncbi:hypothetical protein MCAMS1_01542 [biofilm metagenome]